MSYHLFLDDMRTPSMCNYMKNMIYFDLEWVIVRSYDEFVKYITENGLPKIVSFDHDLAEVHYHESMYQGKEAYMKYLETVSEKKTGKNCAEWMIDYCMNNELLVPIWYVHSMNPVGKENIESYISGYMKFMGQERI